MAKKNCQNGGEGITRENMGYCKQDGLGVEKEMGFIDCEGEKERVKGKNKKVTGSKINRSLPDFIGITTKL